MDAERAAPREIELSRIWAEQRLPGDLRLTDGRRVQVIYPGVWSNSDGPDFKNAMLSIDGRLSRGAVELHLRASDWSRHGHDGNPAYDDVILHVVLDDDLGEAVRASNGVRPATLTLREVVQLPGVASDPRAQQIVAALGSRTCLPTLGKEAPELIRAALRARGWSRLVEKQLRFSQDLQVLTAPEVLYRGVLDALGYSANRDPMVEVGRRMPLQLLERARRAEGEPGILAGLLGTAGFLPLSPVTHELCGSPVSAHGIERCWDELSRSYAIEPISTGAWTLNRVRPANHPVARLASLASLIAGLREASLFEHFLGLPLDGGKSWERWLASARPSIGASRRQQVIVNIFAPFLAAYTEVTRDDELSERVAGDWERLPGAVSDRIARQTRRQIVGNVRFPIKLALEEQGLHEIYRNGCAELRCFECPIARLAIEREPWASAATGSSRT